MFWLCCCFLSSSSPALQQTQALALLLRLEAVPVAAAAAVPEARALALLGVEEPHHGVVLTAALVLRLEAGVFGAEADELWFGQDVWIMDATCPETFIFRFKAVGVAAATAKPEWRACTDVCVKEPGLDIVVTLDTRVRPQQTLGG